MSNFPRWDQTEFGCLKKDLSGIFAYIKFLEIKTRADAARSERLRIMSMPPEGLALMEDIQTVCIRIMGRMWKKEERPNVLPEMRQRFVEATMNVSLLPDDREAQREKIAREIMNLYYGFDLKEFEKDFKAIFFDECTNSSTATRLDKLNSTLKKTDKEMADSDWMKTDPAKWFQTIPHRWRDRLVHAQFKHDAMGRHIIETFVSDWKQRVVKFNAPVSVTGVLIQSMPRQMADTWLKAYKLLGFDKLDLRGIYNPRLCDIQEEKKPVPAGAKIPKFFQST